MVGSPLDGNGAILTRLMAVIEDRKQRRPDGSYTTRLLEGGAETIGSKVLEEAAELVAATQGNGQAAEGHSVLHEAADLVYHLLVLMVHCGISLRDLEGELARRFGVSGLAEKAGRRSQES